MTSKGHQTNGNMTAGLGLGQPAGGGERGPVFQPMLTLHIKHSLGIKLKKSREQDPECRTPLATFPLVRAIPAQQFPSILVDTYSQKCILASGSCMDRGTSLAVLKQVLKPPKGRSTDTATQCFLLPSSEELLP